MDSIHGTLDLNSESFGFGSLTFSSSRDLLCVQLIDKYKAKAESKRAQWSEFLLRWETGCWVPKRKTFFLSLFMWRNEWAFNSLFPTSQPDATQLLNFLKTIQLHAERRGELVGLDFITFHFSWVVTQHDREEGKVLTKDFKRFSRSYPGDYFH